MSSNSFAFPKRDAFAFDDAEDSFAGIRLKALILGELQSSRLSAGDNCRRQRMLASLLQTRRQPQHLRLTRSRHDFHGHQLRLALGERAGLVDHHRVDFFQNFERFGVLDQHACASRRGRCRP